MAPVTEYTTDDLVESAKLRGLIPKGTFDTADLLRFATEEMRIDLVPLILSAREDYFTTYADFATVVDSSDPSGKILGPFQLPARAVANKARLVQLVNGDGATVEIGRIQLETVPYERIGFFLRGNAVYVLNLGGTSYPSVRIYFYARLNRLVPVAEAAFVQSFNAPAKTITLASVPTSWSGTASYDLIRATPTFDAMASDQSATLASSTLTFTNALPSTLAVGDEVALAGTSAIVQLPVEFIPVLAQSIACKALEAEGDREGLQVAMARYEQMRRAALNLITNRADGNPKHVVPVRSPWRQWR